MATYSNFLARVRSDGLARQNRFWVSFGALVADENITMMCKSVSLPGVSLSTSPIRTTGEVFEAPYDRNFSPVTLTFYVDRNMEVRRVFDSWIERIQDSKTRVFGWYADFAAPQMEIYVDNKNDQSVYKVTLYDAHPKTIGSLSLDNAVNDVMIFDVTFDYHYYTTSAVGGEAGGGTPAPEPQPSFDYESFLNAEFQFDGVAGI